MTTKITMNLTDLGIVPIFRVNRRRTGGYDHRDQINYYSINGQADKPSEAFRKRFRFQEKTVQSLAFMLEDEIGPKAMTNNAF